ncbi:MAG: hypothetical protein OWR52_01500 [Acidibacillus sp.]|nr:hypothetical protein [Acidibacillus sp.]
MKKRFKRWTAATLVTVVVIGGGLVVAEHVAQQKVADQVVLLLSQPGTQQAIAHLADVAGTKTLTTSEIEQALTSVGTSQASGSQAKGSTNTTHAPTSSHTGSSPADLTSSQPTSASTDMTNSTSTDASPSGADSSGNAYTSSSSSANTTGSTSSTAGLTFTSRQQVISFAISKFTPEQVAYYTNMYMERSTLSPAVKMSIKAQILSHFTPNEIQSMIAALQRFQ